MSHHHYSYRPTHSTSRPHGFWGGLFRLAGWGLLLILLVSGGLWLIGLAASLLSTLLVLALLAAPFLFVVWVVWLVRGLIFGR